MTQTQTAVAALCILALVLAIAGLLLSPSRGATGYWFIALLCSAACLLDLLRSRRRGEEKSRKRTNCSRGEQHEDPTPPSRPHRPKPDLPRPHRS